MLLVCPREQISQDKEHHDNKSNRLGDENIGKTRSKGLTEHDKKIIKPILRIAAGELPSKQRPEEIYGLCPHAILDKMEERSYRYQEYTRIPAAPVDIKTCKSKEKAEYKCMGNKIAAGNGISEEHPANRLINNIRKYGSKCRIRIIYAAPHIGHEMLNDESETKCNPKMTENEHIYPECFTASKMLPVQRMHEIESKVHRAGYHCDVLGKAKKDYKRVIELFERRLSEFGKICGVKTSVRKYSF